MELKKLERMIAPAGTPVTVDQMNWLIDVINVQAEMIEALMRVVDSLVKVDESSE